MVIVKDILYLKKSFITLLFSILSLIAFYCRRYTHFYQLPEKHPLKPRRYAYSFIIPLFFILSLIAFYCHWYPHFYQLPEKRPFNKRFLYHPAKIYCHYIIIAYYRTFVGIKPSAAYNKIKSINIWLHFLRNISIA